MSTHPPQPLTTQQLESYQRRITNGGLAEVRLVYAELADKGYNYASWAAGVANGNTITGVSAVDFLKGTALLGLGSEECKNLSVAQTDAIRVSMGEGYIGTLIRISKDSGDVLSRDVKYDETKAFHESSFVANGLSLSNWTLSTPMELLRQNQGDAAVETWWQQIRDTEGTGIDSVLVSSKLANMVGHLAFSDDPAIRSQALT